jgi:hypothetical protein
VPTGPTIQCPGAVTVTNAGNIPLDFTGPAGSTCTSTNLAPQATFNCELPAHTITQFEREAGQATLQFAVDGKRPGADGAAQLFVMASTPVAVWQDAAMSLTVQETSSGTHTSNSECHICICVSCGGSVNPMAVRRHVYSCLEYQAVCCLQYSPSRCPVKTLAT